MNGKGTKLFFRNDCTDGQPRSRSCSRALSRRQYCGLTALSTLPIAGCLDTFQGTEAADRIDLRLLNESSETVQLSITFETETEIETDGDVAFDETYTLGPTETETEPEILESGRYRVTVERTDTDAEPTVLEYDALGEDCNKWVSVTITDHDGVSVARELC